MFLIYFFLLFSLRFYRGAVRRGSNMVIYVVSRADVHRLVLRPRQSTLFISVRVARAGMLVVPLHRANARVDSSQTSSTNSLRIFFRRGRSSRPALHVQVVISRVRRDRGPLISIGVTRVVLVLFLANLTLQRNLRVNFSLFQHRGQQAVLVGLQVFLARHGGEQGVIAR